jgi:DNA-binding winged helix-turn-helix (wHTH) protein
LGNMICKWDAFDLEEQANRVGLQATVVRSALEFLETEQCRSLEGLPLVHIEKIADGDPMPFTSQPLAPLSGVRALGFSHVIAGPGLGRALAYHGADVLNLWTPNDFEMDFNYYSAHVGMRSAIMDFGRPDEMARFRRLVARADILFANRRPGLLEKLGITSSLPARRLLLEGDKPVRLGSRALDILVALVERVGRVVSREELSALVWPNLFIEESNLRIQVSALRRALGDGQAGNRYIATVPGRGYEFVAAISITEMAQTSAPSPAAGSATARHNLPVAFTRMIGRADIVVALAARLQQEPLLTIVGPGGIGKTTVALGVAETIVAAFEDGVWLVDLSRLGDPGLVAAEVAAVLGLEIASEQPLAGLIAALRAKRMLLLFDNCEHVIEATAALAEGIISDATGVRILATSREPLRVAGERLYRLPPLANPPASSGVTAAEALYFPAVQLFVERAAAVSAAFELRDADAPLVVDICRRLDGLPLAIEFAASRIDVLGTTGLAGLIEGQLRLLGARRRGWHRGIRRCARRSTGVMGC